MAMKFRHVALQKDSAERYVVAGAICSLSTNSEAIHRAMRESYAPAVESGSTADLTISLWVDAASQRCKPWPQPYFRGLGHLVFASFDLESELLVDLGTRRIMGRLSPAMAADQIYLRRVILPTLFGIVCQTLGVTPLHCACVEWNGGGVLLAGESGSGKSTLALALAQSGLAFLSDDWTYLSRKGGRVVAWSLNNFMKLLPDAVEYFPRLAAMSPTISLNGELAYEMEPERTLGIQRSVFAEPRCLMFLERLNDRGVSLTDVTAVEAATRLERNLEDLPAAIQGTRDFLLKTIGILVQRPCWELRYGAETPQAVAARILRFLDDGARCSALRTPDKPYVD